MWLCANKTLCTPKCEFRGTFTGPETFFLLLLFSPNHLKRKKTTPHILGSRGRAKAGGGRDLAQGHGLLLPGGSGERRVAPPILAPTWFGWFCYGYQSLSCYGHASNLSLRRQGGQLLASASRPSVLILSVCKRQHGHSVLRSGQSGTRAPAVVLALLLPLNSVSSRVLGAD